MKLGTVIRTPQFFATASCEFATHLLEVDD